MPFTVAPMQRQEAPTVAGLWRAYMTGLSADSGDMTANVFLRDGLGDCFHTMVARRGDGDPVAVCAWWMTYDVHHAAKGGEIPDMFVIPACRGLGVAVQLIAAVARSVRERGGVFLRGPATSENADRLVKSGHLDAAFPVVHVYWTRALFAILADNADADARTLARHLAAARADSPAERQ